MALPQHLLLRITALLVVVPTVARAQVPVYSITDIGPIHAAGIEYVAAINDQGQVTSTTTTRTAFLWDNGQITSLPSLQAGFDSFPRDLSNGGIVIGTSMVSVQPHAVVWQAGLPLDLGVLGGLNSEANAINESGQVVGSWRLAGGGVDTHAFLYDAGTFTDLGGFGGNSTRAKGINRSGTIVGASSLAVGAYNHAFVWSGGQMTDIGAWAGTDRESVANAINDAGTVVGVLEPGFGNGWLAFVYENGQMRTIPGLPNAEQSNPLAINIHRQITGWTQFANSSQVATLFQGGVAYDLNTLIPSGSGWQLLGASDINERGQIVGLGTYGGTAHAFLLTPQAIVTNYCTSTINSSGAACVIEASGLPSVSRNEFDLVVTGAAPNKAGMFYYNAGQRQVPFGNGYLCVGGGAPTIYRLGPTVMTSSTGVAVRHLDFGAAPAASGLGAISPLATWNFQFYFRDPAAGGARFNLSDAMSVTFCP